MATEEFTREIFLLMEKGLSISPQGINSNDLENLTQYFKDKNIQPTIENVYMLVIKSKTEEHDDFNEAVVTRCGELLWLTVPEEEERKIKGEYQNIVDKIINKLSMSMQITSTTSTNEQPWEDIFNDGINYTSQISQSSNARGIDMLEGILP
ncbi:3892_t:CDS:1 [Gigaspora margarita]|uniref:3892_t:CDS:1 n=1 Tax=Gigaspora margarita TaxID=4874 RepID=A0ABN7VMY4_GIGMA|nr:3892_t:CDS:1 [Gigaspora margarita]